MATDQPQRALAFLDEHERRFARGALRVARLTDRVLVNCMLGRADEAHRDAVAVLAREPIGPHADIVRGSCIARTLTVR